MNFVKTGKLVSLSEQNLVDCDKLDHACTDGFVESAYTFISKNGGIDTEASYPYTGEVSTLQGIVQSQPVKNYSINWSWYKKNFVYITTVFTTKIVTLYFGISLNSFFT